MTRANTAGAGSRLAAIRRIRNLPGGDLDYLSDAGWGDVVSALRGALRELERPCECGGCSEVMVFCPKCGGICQGGKDGQRKNASPVPGR